MSIKYLYKTVLVSLFLFCLFQITVGNNVRVTRNVSVDPDNISNNIAVLNFGIAWDNSWRDDFNWDAVYIFFKYRKEGEKEWKHVSLRDETHSVSPGYGWWTARSATANDASGIFVYRSEKGLGESYVDVDIKWQIDKDGLIKSDFQKGFVEYTAMAIEMVYVPKGPFCIGDCRSINSLGKKYRTILPEWDLIKLNDTLKFTASGDPLLDANYINYPPQNAANRVNETRNDYSNAWYATEGTGAVWGVEFPKNVTIRYFGVSGVRGYPAYRPTKWTLYASADGKSGWTNLMNQDLTAEDWVMEEYDVYPVPKAIKVDKPGPYKFYQIRVLQSSYLPMANCISMTDKNIEELAEDSYVVDRQYYLNMNATTGLFTETAVNGQNLNVTYPTGYEGFYAMKYEITQEQYVRFLNKLQYNQQKNRTIGDALDALPIGNYVYGGGGDSPSFRNGIKLSSKVDGNAVFVNDLDPDDGSVGLDGDGQTLACNYLSPMDMLAYASWTGLRPLSEMEYEKMARGLYPEKPIQYEVAWNTAKDEEIIFPNGLADIVNPGARTEKVSSAANVNAGNTNIAGPVRVGSFAKGAGDQIRAGASYWGFMELSGNLAEMYYNVTTAEGREFDYIKEAHGVGTLVAESTPAVAGNPTVSTAYWSQAPRAFILKGGSFMTVSRYDLAISAREYDDNYFKNVNKKDSTVTFRLGHSYSNLVETEMPVQQQCTTYLKLANGKMSTTDGAASDYACTASTYSIVGSPLLVSSNTTSTGTKDIVKTLDGKCDYIWLMSENSGGTWRIIPNQDGRDLEFADFGNDSPTNRTVWIKRQAITPGYFSETKYVVLNIINTNFKISDLTDTIRMTNQANGFLVETKGTATYTWRWKAKGNNAEPFRKTTTAAVSDYYFPERSSFDKSAIRQNNIIVCEMNFQDVCKRKVEVGVYIEERPDVGVASGEIVSNGTGPKRCGVMMQANDGLVYGTVQIGNQCWMAENLRHLMGKYSAFQTEDPNGERTGVLYNWASEVVNNACPTGWRLPKNADFEELKKFLGDEFNTGKMLKGGNQWSVTTANKLHRGTNTVGFGFIGGGYNQNSLSFNSYGYLITEEGTYWYVGSDFSDLKYGGNDSAQKYWMHIRCIKR